MKITMDDSRITSIAQLREFLKTSQGMAVSLEDAPIKERYEFIDKTVDRLDYQKLRKRDKRVVVNYLRKITGYKHTQLFRLVKRAERGKLVRNIYHRVHPVRIYDCQGY